MSVESLTNYPREMSDTPRMDEAFFCDASMLPAGQFMQNVYERGCTLERELAELRVTVRDPVVRALEQERDAAVARAASFERLKADAEELANALRDVLAGHPVRNADELIARYSPLTGSGCSPTNPSPAGRDFSSEASTANTSGGTPNPAITSEASGPVGLGPHGAVTLQVRTASELARMFWKPTGIYGGPMVDGLALCHEEMETIAKALVKYAKREQPPVTGDSKDAARYRFLKQLDAGGIQVYFGPEDRSVFGDELDERIDAAMQPPAQGSGT